MENAFNCLKNRLSDSGFQTGPFTENTAWYFKIMPPVLYAVCLLNNNLNEDTELKSKILLRLINDISNYKCSNVVCVNVAVTDNTDDVYHLYENKNFELYDNIHNVYWIFDTKKESIFVPKGQPSKLNGIERCFDFGKNGFNDIKIENNNIFVTYVLIAVNIAVWAYIFFGKNDNIIDMLAISRNGLIKGQIYRLITAMFVHRDIKHIFFNCFSLYIFGRETEKILSRKNFMFLYFVSGIVASLASAIFNNTLSIGASGAIFGIIGTLAAVARVKMYKAQMLDYFSLILYAAIAVLMGFGETNVDNYAHIAGFLSGFLIESIYISVKYSKKQH